MRVFLRCLRAPGCSRDERPSTRVPHASLILVELLNVTRPLAPGVPDAADRGPAQCRPSASWFGIESGALFADGVYTQRALKNYPELFREADPIARPFVLRGWSGQIAGGAIFVGADVGLRYLFHQKGHHRLERLLPLVLTVYGTAGAIHGARELRRVERGR